MPLYRLNPLPLPQRSGPYLLLCILLDFLQDIVLIIIVVIINCVDFIVYCIHRPPLLSLIFLIEYLFDTREEFPSRTCTIGYWKIITCHLPTINCTSVIKKFLPRVKEIFDNPLKVKKRRSRPFDARQRTE